MYRLIQTMYDEDCEFEEFEDGINIIEYDNFKKLMDICFRSASYFSFTKAPWAFCTKTELAEELEPFLIKRLRSQKWFCYDFSPTDQFMDINIYEATPSVQSILQKYFFDIFLNELRDNRKAHTSQTLEDLCFFTKNTLLLGTVSHECICHVYPPDEAMAEEIVATGRWRYGEDNPSEQINIEQILLLDVIRD